MRFREREGDLTLLVQHDSLALDEALHPCRDLYHEPDDTRGDDDTTDTLCSDVCSAVSAHSTETLHRAKEGERTTLFVALYFGGSASASRLHSFSSL